MDRTNADAISAPAWHAPAFNPFQRYTAGMLTLAGDRLSFATDKGSGFDVAMEDVSNIDFVLGDSVMKCSVGDKKYRLFFAKPAGAKSMSGTGGGVGGAMAAVTGTKSILDSRSVGKTFKAALSL